MRIVDSYSSNNAQFFTVELEEDVFVDVKSVDGLFYVMSCGDGYYTYNSDGNSFDYHFDTKELLAFVISYSEKNGGNKK